MTINNMNCRYTNFAMIKYFKEDSISKFTLFLSNDYSKNAYTYFHKTVLKYIINDNILNIYILYYQ